MRTSKVCSQRLSSTQYGSTDYGHHAVVTRSCILSSWLLYFTTESLCFGPLTPFACLPPHFRNRHSILCICELGVRFFCWFVLDSAYTWDQMVFVFLWLRSLSRMPSRFIHAVTNGKTSTILWTNNIPWCMHVFTNKRHIFIHSSTDGHFCGFHICLL